MSGKIWQCLKPTYLCNWNADNSIEIEQIVYRCPLGSRYESSSEFQNYRVELLVAVL